MVCSNFNILCVSDCKNLAKFISQTTVDCENCILEYTCSIGSTCFNNWLDALTKEDSIQYERLQQYINSDIVNNAISDTRGVPSIDWESF